jgi:hypothetical protein
MVTFSPLASTTVSSSINKRDESTIVPLQLNVTNPPPLKADNRLASSQTETSPPALTGEENNPNDKMLSKITKYRNFILPFPSA